MLNDEIKNTESNIMVIYKKTRCFKCSNYCLVSIGSHTKRKEMKPISSVNKIKNKSRNIGEELYTEETNNIMSTYTETKQRKILNTQILKSNQETPRCLIPVSSINNCQNKNIKTETNKTEINKKEIGKSEDKSSSLKLKFPFSQNVNNGMIIVAGSSLLKIREKINLPYLNKEMLNAIKSNFIIKTKTSHVNIDQLQININTENKIQSQQLNIYETQIMNYLNKYPSETAQMTLSFFTLSDENEILKEASISLYLLDLLCIFLQEKNNFVSIREGFDYLYNKYKVTSLKNLLFRILNKVFFCHSYTIKERDMIVKLGKNILKLLDSINRRISQQKKQKYNYLAFILIEISQYFTDLQYLPEELIVKLKERRQLEILKHQ